MKKVIEPLAADIAKRFELLEQSNELLEDEPSPPEFLQLLIDNKQYHDAILFLAHALPAREAVWWACVCARYHAEEGGARYQLSLKAAETWVYEPNELNRRVCERYSEEGDFATAVDWLCAAAFWGGGSIAPKDAAIMEAPAYLYSQGVTGAIVMLAGWGDPDEAVKEQRYEQYIKHGINIADGGNG